MTAQWWTTQSSVNAVLVATDGSRDADAAVDWAAASAVERGCDLLILTAVAPPSSSEIRESVAEFGGSASLVRRGDKAERRERVASDMLDRATVRVRAAFPDLRVETAIYVGSPQAALQSYAPQAELMVIGTRGFGPVRSELLGSVGLWARRHLAGPLAIVGDKHGHIEVVLAAMH